MLRNNLKKEPRTNQSYTILYQNHDGIRNVANNIADDIANTVENFICSPELKPKLVRILTKETIYLAGEQLKAELYYNSERMLKG